MSGLSPNDLEPCGTPTAKRRHVALAEHCSTCGTEGRRTRRPTLADLVAERRRFAAALESPTAGNRRLRALPLVPDGAA